jgi:hypothetical protein
VKLGVDVYTKGKVEVTEMFNNMWALLVVGFVVLVLLGVVGVTVR